MEEDPMFFSCVTKKIIEKYFLPKKQKKIKLEIIQTLAHQKNPR